MNNRIDAIYARQSVDKKDSISIESQIEFCKYELKGGNCKEYTDKGYSGKNTDRPKFQELVRDIKRGLIAKVVVYKLDRISRSILDFANMMELFQQYNVEFVSSTEKFDTVHLNRLCMEAVRGFPTHLETSLATGIVSVRYPLLYGFPLKLGEHDTDIQHRPPHRGGGIKLFRRGHKLHIVLLEQLHHIGKVQNGTADTVELVNHDFCN